eukprot:6181172-Pleurochrysis_carterae.AAC.4
MIGVAASRPRDTVVFTMATDRVHASRDRRLSFENSSYRQALNFHWCVQLRLLVNKVSTSTTLRHLGFVFARASLRAGVYACPMHVPAPALLPLPLDAIST